MFKVKIGLRYLCIILFACCFLIASMVFSSTIVSADTVNAPGQLYVFENPPGFGAIEGASMAEVYQPAPGDDYSSLPTAVDLSAHNWFPTIRTQKGGSCVAWSTTYYQYTYEAARLNGWDAKHDDSKVASPKYTWNFANGGVNQGVWAYQCYDILKYGCVSWADFPQTSLSFDWYTGSTQTETFQALNSALKTRISNNFEEKFASEQNSPVITSYNDDQLNRMKSLLNEGHPLNIYTYVNSFYTEDLADGRKVCLYLRGNNGYHAMTVVGYDDTLCYDLNLDGSIQNYEKGAFKIANSWGESYGKDGYIWVMYDALNRVSNANNLQFTDRTPAFESNLYRHITVENYDPQLMVEITLQQTKRSDISIYLGSKDSTSSTITEKDTFLKQLGGDKGFNGVQGSSGTRTFLFDYSDLFNGNGKIYSIGVKDNVVNNPTVVTKIRWLNENGTVLQEISPQSQIENVSAPVWFDYLDGYIKSTATPVYLHVSNPGTIEESGSVHYYKFVPSVTGKYLFYTTGSTDTIGTLYDSSNNQLKYNDDAYISGNNFCVQHNLSAGQTYYLKVSAYGTGTGSYTLILSRDLYNASLASNYQDARCVKMQAEGASILKTLTVKFNGIDYVLNKPASGNLDTTVNGRHFKVIFTSNSNNLELSTVWEITAELPATSVGTVTTNKQNVQFVFSEGSITSGTKTISGFVAYGSSFITGLDDRAAGNLQTLINTLRTYHTNESFEVWNWDNSLVNVSSSTKGATGMKIIHKQDNYIVGVYYLVVFGDINGTGTPNLGDGDINANDALKVLQESVDKTDLVPLALIAADANHDGLVNANDALLINKHAVLKDTIVQAYTINVAVPDECYLYSPVIF